MSIWPPNLHTADSTPLHSATRLMPGVRCTILRYVIEEIVVGLELSLEDGRSFPCCEYA